MRCVVYKSIPRPGYYLYVERCDDFSRVPDNLLLVMGRLEFVIELKLDGCRRLAQADIHVVRQQLAEAGYYLQMPPGQEPGPVQ